MVNSPVRRHVGVLRTSHWAGLKRCWARLPGARFCRPFRWNLRRIVWRARPLAGMASLRPRGPMQRICVRRYQIASGGYWLLCYCRPEADRPPVLMPVAETHSQRQLSTQGLHTSACEAIQEPDVQRSWAPTALRPISSIPWRGHFSLKGDIRCKAPTDGAFPLERASVRFNGDPCGRGRYRPG